MSSAPKLSEYSPSAALLKGVNDREIGMRDELKVWPGTMVRPLHWMLSGIEDVHLPSGACWVDSGGVIAYNRGE